MKQAPNASGEIYSFFIDVRPHFTIMIFILIRPGNESSQNEVNEMKRKLLSIAAAVSLCLFAAAGCSPDTEQPDGVPTPPVQESAEQSPEPVTDTTEPIDEAPAPDDAVSADLSAEPPYLHVTYGDETLDVRGWNWEWTVQNPDGTTQTLTPQWATAYPLDWVDTMDTLVMSDEKTVTLSFAVEPDTVTAHADSPLRRIQQRVCFCGKRDRAPPAG